MNEAMPRSARCRRVVVACAALLYVGLGIWKMAPYAVEGRFWAEDGAVFYTGIAGRPLWQGLTLRHNAHLELLANLVILASTGSSFVRAPLVSTWLAFAVQAAPVLFVIANARDFLAGPWSAFVFVGVAVGLPQAPEVWANATNLHFHMALLGALLLVATPAKGRRKWLRRGLLLLVGLGGIPGNYLLVVALGLALAGGTRERWVQAGILGTTTALQLALLFVDGFDSGSRVVSGNLPVFFGAALGHQLAMPFLGVTLGGRILEGLRSMLMGGAGGPLLVVGSGLLVALGLRALDRSSGDGRVRVLILSALLLAYLSFLGSLGSKGDFFTPYGGGRYFYVPNLLLALALIRRVGGREGRGRSIAAGLLAVLTISCLSRIPVSFVGPPWRESLRKAEAEGRVAVEIWPRPWRMMRFDDDGQPLAPGSVPLPEGPWRKGGS